MCLRHELGRGVKTALFDPLLYLLHGLVEFLTQYCQVGDLGWELHEAQRQFCDVLLKQK